MAWTTLKSYRNVARNFEENSLKSFKYKASMSFDLYRTGDTSPDIWTTGHHHECSPIFEE